jgi:uncharacterized iron-regulated protein
MSEYFYRNSFKFASMKYSKYVALLVFVSFTFKSKPAYQIFSGEKSKSIDFDKMIKGLKDADVIFFGENHNDPICHWLELQVLKVLGETTGKKVILGAEMFETDNQLLLDEYISGLIREDHFINESKAWDNYKTDYAPIINYAKSNGIPVVATNIPRRYANLVARSGLEGLDELQDEAKHYIVPLPFEINYELSSYKEVSSMMGGHMGPHTNGINRMVNAQAIKDATMAHFISTNWEEGSVFYHLNGSFHSKNKEGIVYYLQKQNPDLNIVTISVIEQEDIQNLADDNKGQADYIIAVPSDMTKTY